MNERLTFADLWEQLQHGDETVAIEAKRAEDVGKSIEETISAFSNEPGRGGGYFLLGLCRTDDGYEIVGVPDPDKLQRDLVSLCQGAMSTSIRPSIDVELYDGKPVVLAHIPEADPLHKPVYIKRKGLQGGTFRRIGATDQRCTDDDLSLLFQLRSHKPFDSTSLPDMSLEDFDPRAIATYRRARERTNPAAAELHLSDEDLLQALGATARHDQRIVPTVAGLMLFGTRMALRREFPMARVDYIRVTGREWVENPDERYQSLEEWLSPLMLVATDVIGAVMDDIPKSFFLPEGEIYRRDIPIVPERVIREAVVNALMHRSYRTPQPTQIIRYSNRIEIRNAGASLVPEDQLGEPGSVPRNPKIAAVFHDTGLAENKGTGVRTMREAMRLANLTEPIFDSDRGADRFAATLLVIHLFGEADVAWLSSLKDCNLSEDEARALVVLREIGAINNAIYRDINRLDTLTCSKRLQRLRDLGLIEQHGAGAATYYVPGHRLLAASAEVSASQGRALPEGLNPLGKVLPERLNPLGKPLPEGLNPLGRRRSTPVDGELPTLPPRLSRLVDALGERATRDAMRQAVLALCAWKEMRPAHLAQYLRRNPIWVVNAYLRPMLQEGLLELVYPDTLTHPFQAYRATKKITGEKP